MLASLEELNALMEYQIKYANYRYRFYVVT